MLQKSKSKIVSKITFLVISPLMLVMVTYVSCSQNRTEEGTLNQIIENGVLTIHVDDFENLTAGEKELIEIASGKMSDEAGYQKIVIKENERTVATLDYGTMPLDSESSIGYVPFAVIEEVPIFPGCEDLLTNKDRKDCITEKISQHVKKHFNTSLRKEHGLEEIIRFFVQLEINVDGTVEVHGVRAPHPALEKEAERIVNLLPKMVPGRHQGQKVVVLYNVPIIYRVSE